MSRFIDPRSKLHAHLGRIGVIQDGGVPGPVNVEIDLSNRCSLGCEWCHFAYTHVRGPLKGAQKPAGAVAGGDLMDTALARSIIDQLVAAKVESVTWTGGGEPTLHPDFDEVIAHAAGRLAQGIYTHGGHLPPARAALLKRALTFVYVSLDAADRESYLRDKRVDRFGEACEGIARLAKSEGDATIGVGYLVTEKNWRQATTAVTLAQSLGADYVQLRPTIAYDQDDPAVLAENTAWLNEACTYLRDLARAWGDFVQFDSERFDLYREWTGHPYRTCWWSALQTVITPNGKVWTCVNKREHPAAEIGDLTVSTFAKIMAGRKLAAVDGDCRVMCRGHIANLELDQMLAPREHAAFV